MHECGGEEGADLPRGSPRSSLHLSAPKLLFEKCTGKTRPPQTLTLSPPIWYPYPLVESVLNLAQIVISLLLVAAVLVQQRDAGLSSVFGGDTTVYHTRRGIEKMIFKATVGLAVIFMGTALANIVLR